MGEIEIRPGRASHRLRVALLLATLVSLLVICAVMPPSGDAEGGVAVAWGENYYTQLGAGYKSARPEPLPVSVVGLEKITALAAGDSFDIALLSSETVDSWGGNTYAQLGDNSRENTWEKQIPHVAVQELSSVRAITASGEHALALLADGKVMAWGTNMNGELGDGEAGRKTNKEVPSEVPGLSHVEAIAAGGASDFALLEDGELMAWGSNTKGQLGIGVEGPEECEAELAIEPCSKVPRAVLLPEVVTSGEVHITAIAAGTKFALALLSNGQVLAWGANEKGELGTGGATTDFFEPQFVANLGEGTSLGRVIAISAGEQHALATLENHTVVGWGMNAHGALGEKRSEECQKKECYATPQKIAGLEGATSVAAGHEYSLVLAGGKVYSFGLNDQHQLGRETTEEVSRVPTAITGAGMEHVTAIAAGNVDAIALLEHGVSGPAPLVTVTPEPEALRLSWTFSLSEYIVCYGEFAKEEDPKCTGSKITLSETENRLAYEEKSYVFSGLSAAVPHVVNVRAKGELGRWLVATPLE